MQQPDKPEAYLNGWLAHKNNGKMESNPYHEWLQAFSHTQWVSGFSARFSAVKYGHDLDLDNMDCM